MKKDGVYEHMEINELDSARFIVDSTNDSKVIVEVINSPHFGDLMVVEIWHGEPLGNECYLNSYREKNFELVDGEMSSEMLNS